jgi:hypothetical protein
MKVIILFGIILLMILQRNCEYRYAFAIVMNRYMYHHTNHQPTLLFPIQQQQLRMKRIYNPKHQQIRLFRATSRYYRWNVVLYNRSKKNNDDYNFKPTQQQLSTSSSSTSSTTTKQLLNGILNRVNRTLTYKTEQQQDQQPEQQQESSSTDTSTTTISTTNMNHNITHVIHEIIGNVTDCVNHKNNNNNDSLTYANSGTQNSIAHTTHSRSTSTTTATTTTTNKNIPITSSDSVHPSPPPQQQQAHQLNHYQQQQQQQQHPDYSHNPTITTTALAHSLWSHVIRPGMDSAIDATAGNGNDSMMIAKLLFPTYIKNLKNNNNNNSDSYNDNDNYKSIQLSDTDPHMTTDNRTTTIIDDSNQSMLYSIDIQEMACYNTTEKLKSVLPSHILQHHVHVLHMSHHEPIPILQYNNTELPMIALVVYNLGYLPGSNSKNNTNKSITTNTITTITSIQNMIPFIRIGGMISITTYPRTNQQEHYAVHVLMESLALFSSQTQNWLDNIQKTINTQEQQQLDTLIDTINTTTTTTTTTIRDYLIQTIQQIYNHNIQQKWRVTQHQKLGRNDAPILYTAVRIQ